MKMNPAGIQTPPNPEFLPGTFIHRTGPVYEGWIGVKSRFGKLDLNGWKPAPVQLVRPDGETPKRSLLGSFESGGLPPAGFQPLIKGLPSERVMESTRGIL